MKSFDQTINYSSTNEDSNSEIQALDIKKSDTVLCITGSGGRSLDLLIKEPKKLISLDFNPCQNYLLELKISAIKNLNYELFIQFMGVSENNNRLKIYNTIRNQLSESARQFWDDNHKIIEKGVIYQGRWEKYFRLMSFLVRLTRPRLLSRLFDDISISKQTRIWTEEWNDWLWQKFMKTIGEKVFWIYLLKDPGFYKYVPPDFNVPGYLINKFNNASQSFHFNKSAFLTLLFWGKFIENDVLPAYLKIENFNTLRGNLNRIEIVTACLGDYLSACRSTSIDKYSLSDFSSYSSDTEYYDIWDRILLTSNLNAKICERQFLVKRDIPARLKPLIRRDNNLEQKLACQDSSVFYTFIIAQTYGTRA
jgi:S-adenosylmethionine:diacylglycerol 3-amino-3-carboxypropyl transferase